MQSSTGKPVVTQTTTTVTTATKPLGKEQQEQQGASTSSEGPAIGLSGGAVSEPPKQDTSLSNPLGGVTSKMQDVMESLKPEPAVEYPVGLSGGAVEGTAEQQREREAKIEQKKAEQPSLTSMLGLGGQKQQQDTQTISSQQQSQSQQPSEKTVVGSVTTTASVTDAQGHTKQATSGAPLVAEASKHHHQQQQTQTHQKPINPHYMEAKGVGSQAREYAGQQEQSSSQGSQTTVLYPVVDTSQPVQTQRYAYEYSSQAPQYSGFAGQGVYAVPPAGFSVPGGYGSGAQAYGTQSDSFGGTSAGGQGYSTASDSFGGASAGGQGYMAQSDSFGAPLGGYGSRAPQAELMQGQGQRQQETSQQQQQPLLATTTVTAKVPTTQTGSETSTRREGFAGESNLTSGRRA
jgi:hypothetical protein